MRRKSLAASLVGLTAAGMGLHLYLRSLSARGYRGPVSDHFDGERFHNRLPTRDKSLGDLVKWQMTSRRSRWHWRDIVSHPTPPDRVGNGELRVTFINHSTMLLQMDGLNILTDPIWSDRTSPYAWLGPKRFHRPGLDFEQLPPIDLVLISHNHWDHLDLPTLQRLAREHQPRIYAGLGNREFLESNGILGAVDMDWGDRLPISEGSSLICVPAQHWSTRTRLDIRNTLWCGFVITGAAGNVYVAGDSGFGPHYQEIADSFAPLRLAVLPIGSYLPRWFMRDNHISPEEAVRAHSILRPSTSVAYHFGTFRLGDEGQTQAVDELRRATAPDKDADSSIWVLEPGEGRPVP